MNRTEIPLSKKKVGLLTLGGLLFVLLGLVMIFVLSDFRWSLFDIIFKAIGLLGFAFGAVAVHIGLKKLLDKKPGLIIDEQGITDNSSGSSLGFIPWHEIVAIRRTTVMDIPMLLIELKHPNEFIDKAKGLIKTSLSYNHEMYGTPLAIAGNTLKCDFNTLTTLLEDSLAGSKNKINQ
jgi:hypothetical protein